jgi:hypothetical protein
VTLSQPHTGFAAVEGVGLGAQVPPVVAQPATLQYWLLLQSFGTEGRHPAPASTVPLVPLEPLEPLLPLVPLAPLLPLVPLAPLLPLVPLVPLVPLAPLAPLVPLSEDGVPKTSLSVAPPHAASNPAPSATQENVDTMREAAFKVAS